MKLWRVSGQCRIDRYSRIEFSGIYVAPTSEEAIEEAKIDLASENWRYENNAANVNWYCTHLRYGKDIFDILQKGAPNDYFA